MKETTMFDVDSLNADAANELLAELNGNQPPDSGNLNKEGNSQVDDAVNLVDVSVEEADFDFNLSALPDDMEIEIEFDADDIDSIDMLSVEELIEIFPKNSGVYEIPEQTDGHIKRPMSLGIDGAQDVEEYDLEVALDAMEAANDPTDSVDVVEVMQGDGRFMSPKMTTPARIIRGIFSILLLGGGSFNARLLVTKWDTLTGLEKNLLAASSIVNLVVGIAGLIKAIRG